MTEQVDAAADGIDDGSDIFAFMLQRIVGSISAVTTTAPVEGPHGVMLLQTGKYRSPGGVVTGGAMYQQQGWPAALPSAGNGRAIPGCNTFHHDAYFEIEKSVIPKMI